jgi:predicted RNA binding protein YcfA (HicA-like mRNA interferase family)
MMSTKKLIRAIEALGWSAERTRGGHIRCRHPDAAYPVFAAATPSDHRQWVTLRGDLRRALYAGRARAQPKQEVNS